MNRLGFALGLLAVVASATWAYHINYRTKIALGRVDDLRGQIAAERESVEVLRVEWAYLNAPERLARLVAQHNEHLGLEPMGPQGLDDVAAVPYPPRNAGPEPIVSDAEIEAVVTVLEQAAPAFDRMPMPAPRPASWRLQ